MTTSCAAKQTHHGRLEPAHGEAKREHERLVERELSRLQDSRAAVT
jgi:hypothetical protein